MKEEGERKIGDAVFGSSALVIVGHGSTENPDSSAPTHAHAREIRKRGIFAEVAACFWKEEPSMRDVFRTVESHKIFVVPNFISEGYFTEKVIPRELGLTGATTEIDGRIVRYCPPVGSHPSMTSILLHRALGIALGTDPKNSSLLIVGHGTSLNDNSARAAKHQVATIRSMGVFGQVEAAYMEEPPLIAEWDSLARLPTVVAVPFFISDGLHSYQDIPVLLGIRDEVGPAASRADVFLENPHHLRGKTLYYAHAIGTEAAIADIILDQARAAV